MKKVILDVTFAGRTCEQPFCSIECIVEEKEKYQSIQHTLLFFQGKRYDTSELTKLIGVVDTALTFVKTQQITRFHFGMSKGEFEDMIIGDYHIDDNFLFVIKKQS